MKDFSKLSKVIIMVLGIVILVLVGIIIWILLELNSKDSSINYDVKEPEIMEEPEIIEEEEDMVEDNSNSVIEDAPETVYTEDEFFDKVKGIYKYVNENGRNYVIRFYKDIYNDNKNSFTYGMYGTDGGIGGEITKVEYLSDSVYKLTVFQKGCHEDGKITCMYESEDATYNIDVNISNIDSKKIDIKIDNNNNITCEYVTDNWDEMDKYFSY